MKYLNTSNIFVIANHVNINFICASCVGVEPDRMTFRPHLGGDENISQRRLWIHHVSETTLMRPWYSALTLVHEITLCGLEGQEMRLSSGNTY